MREVEINSTIYVELKKQYELAKIEEIKNVPIINILDMARPPANKESPKRRLIVASTFFGTFLLSLLSVAIAKYNSSRFSALGTLLFQRKTASS